MRKPKQEIITFKTDQKFAEALEGIPNRSAFIRTAVLAALITPAALAPQGHLQIGPHVWATLAGAAVAWRTRSVLLTILGGMAVFWLIRALGA